MTRCWWCWFLGCVVTAGCAESTRNCTLTMPDGVSATFSARDTFEKLDVNIEAEKTEKGWRFKYGRTAAPDAEAIRASGGIVADVTKAAIEAAIKAGAKAVVP